VLMHLHLRLRVWPGRRCTLVLLVLRHSAVLRHRCLQKVTAGRSSELTPFPCNRDPDQQKHTRLVVLLVLWLLRWGVHAVWLLLVHGRHRRSRRAVGRSPGGHDGGERLVLLRPVEESYGSTCR